MVSTFYNDLAAARTGEQQVAQILEKAMPGYKVENVANEREYFHKGDLILTSPTSGISKFVEVKTDSCIGRTHNILCEESTLFYENNERRKGNFYSDYELYAILSRSERVVYILDFSILKKIYKRYRSKVIKHPEQENLVYLVPLREAQAAGALLTTIGY